MLYFWKEGFSTTNSAAEDELPYTHTTAVHTSSISHGISVVSFMFHRSQLTFNLSLFLLSDTGTKPPESGVFGFMINITALLGMYMVLGLNRMKKWELVKN